MSGELKITLMRHSRGIFIPGIKSWMIAKLIRATAQLYGLLEQIRLLEDGIDEESASSGLHMVRGEELHECEKTLRRLDGLLRKSDPASAIGFVSVARKKLEWPFSGKEVCNLQGCIRS